MLCGPREPFDYAIYGIVFRTLGNWSLEHRTSGKVPRIEANRWVIGTHHAIPAIRLELSRAALPPKADKARTCWDVRLVPKADICAAQRCSATWSPPSEGFQELAMILGYSDVAALVCRNPSRKSGFAPHSVIFTNPCWTSCVVLAMASVLTLISGSRSLFPQPWAFAVAPQSSTFTPRFCRSEMRSL